MTIEKKLEQLETLVKTIETSPVEKAVKSYGKAVQLSKALKDQLKTVESSFELLKKEGDALLVESVTFDEL